MKNKLMCLGLTSLFLLGCSKKNEEIDYESLKSKIENKEDFIFTISSESCSNCINLKKTYNKSKYTNIFYVIELNKIDDGIKNNDIKSKEIYIYLANMVNESYNNVVGSVFNDTYKNILLGSYEEYYGKDSYINGYINLVTPISFFIIDGNVSDFVIGDWSSEIDSIMSNYLKKVG